MTDFAAKYVALADRYDGGLWGVRILLAAMYVESCVDKILNWTTYLAEVRAHHIPWGTLSLALAALTEAAGAIALLTGFGLIPALVVLALYTVTINFFYFDFWNQPMPAAVMARKEFLKNFAVAGGILSYAYIAAFRRIRAR